MIVCQKIGTHDSLVIQLHICVYIDIPNRKEMFIMKGNHMLMTIETFHLEGIDML